MNKAKYVGIYAELVEIIGEPAVEILYQNMAGQQVTFPKRLYSQEYIIEATKDLTGLELKKAAVMYGYTERRLKQLLKQAKESGKSEE